MGGDEIVGGEHFFGEERRSHDERRSIERRMGHLERSLAVQSTLLTRNTEILDDIRNHINTPTNWPAWITTCLGSLTVFGALMYAAYIKPLEDKLQMIQITVDSRQQYVDSYIDNLNRNFNKE